MLKAAGIAGYATIPAKCPAPTSSPRSARAPALGSAAAIFPLGEMWDGVCHAAPGADFRPDESALRNLCNFGYARGQCGRVPAAGPDAARFSVQSRRRRGRRHSPMCWNGTTTPLRMAAWSIPWRATPWRIRRPERTSGIRHARIWKLICAGNRRPAANERGAAGRPAGAAPMKEGKPVRESICEYAELALPTDANSLGNLLGGKSDAPGGPWRPPSPPCAMRAGPPLPPPWTACDSCTRSTSAS